MPSPRGARLDRDLNAALNLRSRYLEAAGGSAVSSMATGWSDGGCVMRVS